MAATRRVEFSKTAFVVVVVLVVAAIIGLRWSPEPEAPAAGDRVLAGVESDDQPTTWGARLAYADLRVQTRVGTRVESEDVPASEGSTRWVEISWQVQTNEAVGTPVIVWPGSSAAERTEKPSRLDLIAGGRTYKIAEEVHSTRSAGSVTVAVADADGLRLRLSSPGRTQAVTAADRPATFTSREDTGRCGREPDRGKVRFSAACRITATRTTYVAGLGWAPRGKDWVVVTEAGRDRRENVVANWWPGEKSGFYHRDSGGRVDYLAAGKPTLRLSVSGAGKPTATYGTPGLTAATARLETRAYQVPAAQEATVKLTYATSGTPDPRTERLPGSPPRITARATGTLTLPVVDRR